MLVPNVAAHGIMTFYHLITRPACYLHSTMLLALKLMVDDTYDASFSENNNSWDTVLTPFCVHVSDFRSDG